MGIFSRLKNFYGAGIRDLVADLLIVVSSMIAAYSAFALFMLPIWIRDRFGQVSPEQILFFLSNPLEGTDVSVKESFIRYIIEEPLLLAFIVIIPGIIAFFVRKLLKLPSTPEKDVGKGIARTIAKCFLAAIAIIAIPCAAAIPAISKGIDPVPFYNGTPSANVLSDSRFLIAHAGGGIGGRPYTNSIEAMEEAAKNGFTMVELDLDLTSDGKIAAVHDWDYFRGITSNPKTGRAMSHEEFMRQKIYGRFSPADEAAINAFFTKNKNIFLITDKIRDYKKLAETFKFTDRIIAETFSFKDYEKALEAGIRYPALNLNALGSVNPKQILKKKILMATVSDVFLEQYAAEIRLLHESGITIMVYAPTKVINNPDYLKGILGRSASMAYVDYCSPKNPECVR